MKRGAPLARRTPLERRQWLRAEGWLPRQSAPGELSATSQTARRQPAGWQRKDTMPLKVRRLVSARDPWCLRCGSPRDLEQHHRRLKQAGGDPRPHTDCCCNLIRLCTGCHAWVHGHRAGAEAHGWRLPAETITPGSDGVMRNSDDGGVTSWPSCGGKWLDEAPADGEAA